MFIIFDISEDREFIGKDSKLACSNCSSIGSLKIYKEYKYFSIFFIRLAKWNFNYYLEGDCCGIVYKIDKDVGRDVEMGRSKKITSKDLKLIVRGAGTCRSCKRAIEKDFVYCPTCGEKI